LLNLLPETMATFAAFGYARARRFFPLFVWAMFGVTLWLLYVQAFVLHAFCRYCLFSAALVFGLFRDSRSRSFFALKPMIDKPSFLRLNRDR